VRKPLMALIARRLGPELNKAFCFGSFRFDRVLIACYDSDRGDYFRRHRDNTTPATAGRRFALTLNLNSDEYDGGELMFPEYGDYRYKPPTGAVVVFSCSLLHEALPVTRGQRFALLSFLLDPTDAPGQSLSCNLGSELDGKTPNVWWLSISTELGPRIGMQRGPLGVCRPEAMREAFGVAQRIAGGRSEDLIRLGS
jgi:hypothetical protein